METKHMQGKVRATSLSLQLAVIALVAICGSDVQAQSGARSSAPAGSGGRSVLSQPIPVQLTQMQPQSFSNPQPQVSSPSFGSEFGTEGIGPSSQTNQGLVTIDDFTTYENYSPDQGSVSGQISVSNPSSVSDQSFVTQPSTVQANPAQSTSCGSSSPGISQSSLVDPAFQIHDPNSPYTVDHSYWDSFLSKYMVKGPSCVNRIQYGQVNQCERQQLTAYLDLLQNTDIRTLSRNEQLAFWFNLYNAKTVSIILDNYPVKSVRQIKQKCTDFVGPFDDPGAVTVLGQPLSLNDIESGIVRPVWNDPRIHYAVNCASFGCPNLAPTAWTATNLDEQLDMAAYSFINSGRAVKSGIRGVRLSKIYKWYADDFGGCDEGVLAHIRQYANDRTVTDLGGRQSISGYFYDWSLNDGRVQRARVFESLRR